ncbi:MAG: Gfo/Idh/MocA family oxidoreductase [Candidatus Marinimicrobia bacterium]|nr:Gfo/Idh/MocA family oxidoreductase [Candidatus Neomarinimicrobiota bacterium]MBT7902001.1 Gfo/Idh/MocA family oxidoreductase [Candidatus Neomarinimicrobiota bacterium]
MINNIGIVGLGSIGRRHLQLVKELRPELNIIAVRSGMGKRVEEEKLISAVVHSLDEAMEYGIEAAIIATPAVYHIQQAIEFMKRGIHLLIEKPLSHSLDDVNELFKMQKKSKSVCLVGYCLHYSLGALKFNDMLKNKNKIGQILHVQVDCGSYLPDWRQGQDYRKSVSAKAELGGGVLLELSHELHYIRWFFGNMKSVSAKIQNSGALDIDVEDSADIIFEAEQGYSVSAHLDFNSRNTRRKCIARCSNGDLIWDAINNEVIWRPADGPEDVKKFQNDRDYIYKEQLKHFFNCIEKEKQPSVSIHDGVAVLRMIESAKQSHKIGKKVAVA